MDKKEKVLLASILMAVSKIEALLREAKCGKCGKCGHQEAEIKKDARTVLLAAKAMGPVKKEAKPERLPDVPDWRDTEAAKQRDGAAQFAEEDELTQIRLIVAAHQGESLAKIIGAIQKETGINSKELAALLDVYPARITEAVHGKARPGFKQIFTQVLGEGADLANNRPNRQDAGTKAKARDHRAKCGTKAEEK